MPADVSLTLRRSLLILLGVTIVTAWFSDLFYFPDEHFQVLEFMSRKLGVTPLADMRWEFRTQIRPWLQPTLYYAVARGLMALGLRDMFAIVFVLRLITGLFSMGALAVFANALIRTLQKDEQRVFARALPVFGFLPYLFVRTASETFCAAFFALALAAALGPKTIARLALAGLLCGLAFESRYQAALLGVGLFGWLVVMARVRPAGLAAFLGGGITALAIGTLCDRWGYGQWVFPPFDYFNVNIVQGVAAKTFGRDPIFAYLYMLPATCFFAITLVVMAGLAAMWLRNPKHILTWTTLPFVALHVAVAHKEARFLFPLAIVATAFPVLGFSPLLPRWRAFFAHVWEWRRGWAAKGVIALSLFFMAWLALYPLGVRPHMPMARYLYRHVAGRVYTMGTPFPDYPMYRHAHLTPVASTDALPDGALLLTDTPTPPVLPRGVKAELVYSEFPLARFGHGQAGSDYIVGYTRFAARARFLRLVPLAWYTLYRVERSAAMRS